MRVENHNDPAGDDTAFTYRLTPPAPQSPIVFTLHDNDYLSLGPFDGTVTVESLGVPGWQVAAINCIGPDPKNITTDVANGRVTIVHAPHDENVCAFTNRRATAGPPGGGSFTGVAPTPITPNPAAVVVPNRPALVQVAAPKAGRVVATVRIPGRSVIRTQLLWGAKRVVGTARVVRGAGTYDLWTTMDPALRSRLRRLGLKRVTLTLRVVVAPTTGATKIFKYRVLVRL